MKTSFVISLAVGFSILFNVHSYAFDFSTFWDEADEKRQKVQQAKDVVDQANNLIEDSSDPVRDRKSIPNSNERTSSKNTSSRGDLLVIDESFGLIEKRTTKTARQSLKTYKSIQPIEYEEEKIIGSSLAIEVFNRFEGAYEDPKLLNYVNLVGTSLANVSDRPDIDYYFGILNSKVPNSFSTPGGYVFLSVGLLPFASVLGVI